jgi:hypothetical protein
MPAKAIQAAVVPPLGQAQNQLAQVGRHLIEAERRLMPTRASAPRKLRYRMADTISWRQI